MAGDLKAVARTWPASCASIRRELQARLLRGRRFAWVKRR